MAPTAFFARNGRSKRSDGCVVRKNLLLWMVYSIARFIITP